MEKLSRVFLHLGTMAVLVFAPIARYSWDLWAQTVVNVFVLILFLLWLFEVPRFPEKKVIVILSIFIILNFISFLFSTNKYNSRNEFFNLLSYAMVFLIAGSFDKEDRKWLINAILLVASILSIISFAKYPASRQGTNGIFQPMAHAYSVLVFNPNVQAGYLLMAIPLFLYEIVNNKSTEKFLYLFFGAVTFLGLLHTKSFGGIWLGLITISAIVIKHLHKKIHRWLFALLLFTVFIYFFINKLYSHSIADRFYWWQAALEMIKSRPLFGVGPGSFETAYLYYKVGGQKNSLYAHNHFLQMAAESGILTLVCFLALVILFFSRKELSSVSENLPDVFLRVSILCILIHNLWDYNLVIPGVAITFWAILGSGFSFQKVDFSFLNNKLRRALVLICIFLVVSPLMIKPFLAGQRYEWGRYALIDGDLEKAENFLKESIRYDFLYSNAHYELSKVFWKRNALNECEKSLQQAIRLNPLNGEFYYALSQVCYQKNDFDSALLYAKKALRCQRCSSRYRQSLERLELSITQQKQSSARGGRR